jgi:ankyrin repeat protein
MPANPAFLDAATKGDLSALQKLLASPDAKTWINELSGPPVPGFTAAHLAAHYGHESLITALAAAGADLNAKSQSQIAPPGNRPLHAAIAGKQAGAVRVLLERGADPNAPQDDGLTPLHLACMTDAIEIVRALLDRGANVHAQARDGNKPLALAAQRGQQPIVELLRQRGASPEPTGMADFTLGAAATKKP